MTMLAETNPGHAQEADAHRRMPTTPLAVERLFEGGTLAVERNVEWGGLRVSLKSVQQVDDFVRTELLSSSHVLFMGIDGKPQNSIIEAESIPRWKGIKGRGRSSFWAAGRRMRCWQSGGAATVLTVLFDTRATEDLLHDARSAEWQSRPSTDEAFIAANAAELVSALQEDEDDLALLRAQTIATNLHLYSVRRFSSGRSPSIGEGDAIGRAIDLIHASFPRAVSLNELVAASGLARGQLLLGFRARTQMSPHQYIIRERLFRAKSLLLGTKRSLAEIAYDVGCANAEHMGRMFRQRLNMSPRAWRLKNGGG